MNYSYINESAFIRTYFYTNHSFAENQINDQLIQVIEQNGHRIDEQLDETVQDVRLNANYSSTETEKQSIEAEKDVIDLVRDLV